MRLGPRGGRGRVVSFGRGRRVFWGDFEADCVETTYNHIFYLYFGAKYLTLTGVFDPLSKNIRAQNL